MSVQPLSITIKATVNAQVGKTWDCYTGPGHIVHWNFASPDWHCPKATNDLTVGGKFTSRMEARDGSMGFDFEGVYTDIREHALIKYVMEDGRKVQAVFKEDGDQTHVTVTFDAENTNPAEMQQMGWQAILDSFKKYTESLP